MLPFKLGPLLHALTVLEIYKLLNIDLSAQDIPDNSILLDIR